MTFLRLRVAVWGVFAGVLAAAGPVAWAQTPATSSTSSPGHETSAASVASYGLSQQMPVDPEVVVGTLPNGLRYYVRANGKPGHRAELRLVVKAGSVLEDDDQQGLAHFVEHMEFEGTRHFPRQSIVDFLSSLGLSIGPDANAATSYDDTQYTLRVPTDVPGVLDRALLVLEDWAQGASFDQSGIDRERGIVLSEWRMGIRYSSGEYSGPLASDRVAIALAAEKKRIVAARIRHTRGRTFADPDPPRTEGHRAAPSMTCSKWAPNHLLPDLSSCSASFFRRDRSDRGRSASSTLETLSSPRPRRQRS